MRAAGADLNGRSTACFLSVIARQQQRSLCRALSRRAPGHGRLPYRRRAVSQIEIDQCLIRNFKLLGEVPKVAKRRLVNPDSDGTLQRGGKRVPTPLREVVFLPHGFHRAPYWARSDRVALRAEIMRIPLSSSR